MLQVSTRVCTWYVNVCAWMHACVWLINDNVWRTFAKNETFSLFVQILLPIFVAIRWKFYWTQTSVSYILNGFETGRRTILIDCRWVCSLPIPVSGAAACQNATGVGRKRKSLMSHVSLFLASILSILSYGLSYEVWMCTWHTCVCMSSWGPVAENESFSYAYGSSCQFPSLNG